jgi:hypothetical protein
MTTAGKAAKLLLTCVFLLFMVAAYRRGQYISWLMLALAIAPLHVGLSANESAVISATRWATCAILVLVAGLVAS